jgi:hypothetical protein
MLDRAWSRDPHAALTRALDLGGVQADGVRQDGARAQQLPRVEPVQERRAPARLGVSRVVGALVGVQVQPGVVLRRQLGGRGQRVVGAGEGRVQADDPARERVMARGLGEAGGLAQAGLGVGVAVAIGGAVAEHRAQAERAGLLGDDVERAVDGARRLVVVDQRGHAGAQRLHRAHRRRAGQGLGVERAIQPPPHVLEDGAERGRGRRRPGHPARERAVQVGVGHHQAGDDGGAARVEHRRVGGERGRIDQPITDHAEVELRHAGRIEGHDACAADQQAHVGA